MAEWRSSLDQRIRAALRLHQKRRNDEGDDQSCCNERRSKVRRGYRGHFPLPAYLGAQQALRGRAMGRAIRALAVVEIQAHDRLGDLSRSGGGRRFGPGDRVPSTRGRDHLGEKGVSHQQSLLERRDSCSRVCYRCSGMAVRFPRCLCHLVLAHQKKPVGKDCTGLAGSGLL